MSRIGKSGESKQVSGFQGLRERRQGATANENSVFFAGVGGDINENVLELDSSDSNTTW